MKRLIFCALITGFAFSAKSQTPYVSVPDPKHPSQTFLVGIISKYILQNDSTYSWYHDNQKNYKPTTDILNAYERGKDSTSFILFGGTWCDDSQFIIPKFFKILELSGYPESAVSFFAADRAKKTLGNLSSALNITNVPTVIVLRKGKEIGRVIEYGKTGKWDAEIAELIR
jgi:hypothetical protein